MDRANFLRNYRLRRSPPPMPSILPDGGSEAAVLIPLLDDGEQLSLLLTRRSSHLRHHPGQISFPGGRREAHDASLLDTALRESNEEIGLDQALVEVIGRQQSLPTISGFQVTPWVALVPADCDLLPDAQEVESLLRVPLRFLLKESNWRREVFERRGRQQEIWFIPYRQHLIWGATAAMLRQLVCQVRP